MDRSRYFRRWGWGGGVVEYFGLQPLNTGVHIGKTVNIWPKIGEAYTPEIHVFLPDQLVSLYRDDSFHSLILGYSASRTE